MKGELNIAIDEDLLIRIKSFALSKQVSVSELVEIYFRTIVGTAYHKSIIELADQLTPLAIEANADLKKTYYEIQGS